MWPRFLTENAPCLKSVNTTQVVSLKNTLVLSQVQTSIVEITIIGDCAISRVDQLGRVSVDTQHAFVRKFHVPEDVKGPKFHDADVHHLQVLQTTVSGHQSRLLPVFRSDEGRGRQFEASQIRQAQQLRQQVARQPIFSTK